MTVASFLLLLEILGGLGGVATSFIMIRDDLEKRGLLPTDALPPEHVSTVVAALAPALEAGTAESFIQGTLGR